MTASFLRLRAFVQLALIAIVSPLGAAPTITQQPAAVVSATSGQPATFWVAANGAGTLRWQWRHHGVPLAGETGPAFTLAAPKMADAGYYDVVLTDDNGSSTSQPSRLLVAPAGGYANSLQLDLSFAAGFEGPGVTVNEVAPAPGGGFYAGGDFTMISGTARANLARFNAAAQLDAGFTPSIDGPVTKVLVQPDGRLLISGDFHSVNGVACNHLARLNTDGSLDPSFVSGTGLAQAATAWVRQPDGHIVLAGIGSYNGQEAQCVRLNSDGSLDPSFALPAGFGGWFTGMVLQSDGRIVVAGSLQRASGASNPKIARLNTDGSLDPSFAGASDFDNFVWSLAQQSDGRLVAGGIFTSYNGTAARSIARLSKDGALDPTFNPGSSFNGPVRAVAVQSDGSVLAGGYFMSFNGASVRQFARLSPSGGLDSAYNTAIGTAFGEVPGGITAPTFLSVLADGRLLAASSFLFFNGAPATGFAVVNPNGTLSVAPTGTSLHREMAELALPTRDGRWIVAGRFTRVNGVDRGRIARLNADGSLDATYAPGVGFNDTVSALTAGVEGKILVGGSFTSFNGTARGGIVRLLADGSVDTTFNSGTGFAGGPRAIALQPDGRVLVGGWFSAYNGTTRNQIARLHADGALDPSFDSGAGPDNSVWAFATQQDGRILIGGMFDSYAGVTRKRFARINSDGSLDASFNAGLGFDSYVRSIDLQSDGGVLVCGDFTKFDGGSRSGFARFRPDGSFDWSFNAGQSGGMVYRVQALADGRSFLLGNVLQQGMSTSGVVRVGADGVRDPSFATSGFSLGSTAADMAWADDGRLLVTYATGARDGAQRYGLVLLKPDVSPAPTITASPASLTVGLGATSGFSVTATGSNLTYWWTRNLAYLAGATQATLSLPNVQLRDVGYYRSNVSNGVAVATSAEATLNLPSFPIATPATDQLGLGVAFDGTNFLVAIQGDSSNATAASAQLVAPDGSLVGGRISLGRNGGQAGFGLGAAKVAFDGTNYLVVWADNAAAPQLRLYGAFVSKAGALVGAPFAFPLATGASTMQRPEGIAFNGTRYLVVYSDGESKPWRLCARFVEPAGVVGGEMPLATNMVGSGQSAASNGNSFFVAWPARLADSQHVVQGRLILGDGGMAAPLTIDGTVSPSYNPVSVASDGLDYLVAWNRDTGPGYPAPTEWELRSRLVQRDNTMPGSIVVVQAAGERPVMPGIAFDGANYLVTWTQVHGGGDLANTTALDVAGRYLRRNGALLGEAFNLVVGAGNQAFTPVAVGAGKALVVYNELGAPFGSSGPNAVRGLLLPASVAPVITAQPASQTFGAGSTAVLSVTASGGGLTYQWRKDGVAISGAVAPMLTLPNVQPANFGSYSVVVTGSGGTATSAPALLGISGVAGTRYRLLDYFYPLVVGNEWLYSRSNEVPARSNSRKRVTSLDHAITGYTGGAAATPVIQHAVAVYGEYGVASGGGFVADEVWIDYFASNGDALGFYGDDEEGPLAVRGDGSLWFPASIAVGESAVTVGDSYANGVWTGPMSIAFRLLGVETVVTPAGTFVGCLHTRFSFVDDGPDVLNDNWWAPGVGWVRTLKRKAGEISSSEELLVSSVVQSPVLPAITVQPAGATIALGATAPLGVTASGTEPLSYQWYRGESGDTASPVVGAMTASFTTPALTAWARYWVRVANRTSYVDSATALVEVTGGTMTVRDWAAQGGVPENQRGPLAMPAGDGVTNLMKFALGVPPLESAAAHLPTATTYAQSGQPLAVALLFAKNPGAQGVRYALEVSDGLATWTEVVAVLEVLGTNPDGTQLVRLREAVPPAVGRRFARLKVEVVP